MVRYTKPLFVVLSVTAAFMLSSCLGSIVQSRFIPESRNIVSANVENTAAATALYVQSTTTVNAPSTLSEIPGMVLTLPAKSSSMAHALVTFNAPTVDTEGCSFATFAGMTSVQSQR